MSRVHKLVVVLGQAGLRRLSEIIYVSYILPLVMEWLIVCSRPYRIIKKLRQGLVGGIELRRYRARKQEVLRCGATGYRLAMEHFGLTPESLAVVKARLQSHPEVIIAEIDQDGFLLSHCGPIQGAAMVSAEDFLPRKRFTLTIVAAAGSVGVKKHYRGDRLSFITELKALHHLGLAGCMVPAIMDADFDGLTLIFSYIQGEDLRLELAKRGAALLDRVIERDPAYRSLSREQQRLKQIEEGKPFLHEVIDPSYPEKLFEELCKIHRAGFLWKDVKYGNMLIARGSGEPYLIDFDSTYDYSGTGRHLFRVLRDGNIEDFNRCFGTEKLTYRRIRDRIRSGTAGGEAGGQAAGYSPAYFGHGLRSGALVKNYVGYGRWHFILKDHLPPLAGARILDLGANDAFHSLQTLRNGAAQVIAIERSSDAMSRGQWFKEVFEWSDDRSYDFRYVQADMSRLPDLDLGRFDFAMALCSIYYLDDGAIADLIAYLSTVTDTCVLQCNTETEIGRGDDHAYVKASVKYAVESLANNGFRVIDVVAPRSYSRPLVIGRRHGRRPRLPPPRR